MPRTARCSSPTRRARAACPFFSVTASAEPSFSASLTAWPIAFFVTVSSPVSRTSASIRSAVDAQGLGAAVARLCGGRLSRARARRAAERRGQGLPQPLRTAFGDRRGCRGGNVVGRGGVAEVAQHVRGGEPCRSDAAMLCARRPRRAMPPELRAARVLARRADARRRRSRVLRSASTSQCRTSSPSAAAVSAAEAAQSAVITRLQANGSSSSSGGHGARGAMSRASRPGNAAIRATGSWWRKKLSAGGR